MRLVDADALYERWSKLIDCMVPEDDGRHVVSMEAVLEDLNRQPTINTPPELKEIISEYDYLLDKAKSGAIFSSSDYEYMDALRNRANDIIDKLIDGGLPYPIEDKDVGYSQGLSDAIKIIEEEI